MVDREYLQGIGLTEDQVSKVKEGIERERRFRLLLIDEGVVPGVVEAICKGTRSDEVDFDNEDLLREKIRVEYSGLIRKKQYQK